MCTRVTASYAGHVGRACVFVWAGQGTFVAALALLFDVHLFDDLVAQTLPANGHQTHALGSGGKAVIRHVVRCARGWAPPVHAVTTLHLL